MIIVNAKHGIKKEIYVHSVEHRIYSNFIFFFFYYLLSNIVMRYLEMQDVHAIILALWQYRS